jgi:hypothetical protein
VAREIPRQKETEVPKATRDLDGSIFDGTFKDRVGEGTGRGLSTDANPASGPPGTGLLDTQPALRRPDWLPEGLFPELDELREEHLEHLNSGAGEKVQELRDTYEAEDAARAEALRLGRDAPAVTPAAERQDALGEAEAEREAAVARFRDFLDRAVERLHALEPEWREQFREKTAEANRKREEAAALLAAAERETEKVARLELWLDRTVNPRAGRYVGAPDLEPLEVVA